MSFQTYLPMPLLRPYIKSLAIAANAEESSYTILPDTSIVMGFQYSGRLSYTSGETIVPLKSFGVTGLQDRYRIFHNSRQTHTVLVMFSETGAAAFFRLPMHELFGQSLSLDDLILRSQMDVVAEQLSEATTDLARIQVVEQFLLQRIDATVQDTLVDLAIHRIRQSGGTLRISDLCLQLTISQAQFEKRFRKMVGASPKKFASIIRFRHLLNAGSFESLTTLGLAAGYYDQAHFIKDFKSFTGQTPEQYFRKK